MAVTRRQKEVLDFLETFVTRNGYSPSYEEIAAILGAIRRLMAPPDKPGREIGFHVPETAPRYRVRKRG